MEHEVWCQHELHNNVALGYPVVPVAVRLGGHQFETRERHVSTTLAPDEHQQVAKARFFGCQAMDLDRFSLPQRRHNLGSRASGLKREVDFVLQVSDTSPELGTTARLCGSGS